MDTNSLKEMVSQLEIPELLPKHYAPKKKYTEISRGIGIGYEERIVESHEASVYVHAGWDINNSVQAYLWLKWKNAIIAMERT